MDKNKCSSCGEAPHKCSCKNKDFTKAVIEIDNPEQITLMRRVVIPASMGDDTTVPPVVGKYHNVLLYYEANQKSYLYSSDGIPTQLVNGITDYEQATNLPQINGVTLLGDKSAADLELADAPMVITVAAGNTSWSGADTAEDVYNFFLNKGKVNIVFSGGENYAYEIASAGYIESEGKLLCAVVAASTQDTGGVTDFDGNALVGTMTLYTAGKAVDVSQIELQPKLFITDFTGLDLNDNELSGVPATNASIGMVKPGDGLEVASDGTLSISDIEQYAHFFDTVADMKAATNLVAGDYARTLGFHAINDGGGAIYKISNTGTANEMDVIAIGDLFAHLVINDEVYVEQFGAKGDGTTDDQEAINRAMQIGTNVIKFIKGKTYAVKAYETGQPEGSGRDVLSAITGVVIPSNKTVDMNFAKIKVISNARKNYNAITIENANNVILKNGYIEGDVDTHTDNGGEWGYGISLRFAKNTVLDNLHVSKCWGDGINLNNDGEATDFNENVIIRNCICDDNRRQGMSIENANHLIVEDSKFINTGKTQHTNPTAGVDIEPAYDYAYNITFVNCEFNDNYNSGLLIDGANIQNVVVDKCLFKGNKATGSSSILYIDDALDIKVTNCTFVNGLNAYKTNVFSPANDLIFENNRLYDIQCHLTGDKSTHAKHYFINNNFYVSFATAYNSSIELAGSTSTNKNELVIVGNSFENTSENESLNIQSYVHGVANKGYVKLTIKNNIFKFGRRVILAQIPAIIENNQFVACFNFPIVIEDHISDIATQIAIIKSNNFEVTGNQTGANYIISSKTAVPMVLLNNTYFTKALNSIDYSGNSFTPTRWYNNTPSNLTEANNNIVSI